MCDISLSISIPKKWFLRDFFIFPGEYTDLESFRYAMKFLSRFKNVLTKHNMLSEIYLVRIQ